MRRSKTITRWLMVISGFFILTATAEKLPPPSETEYEAGGADGLPTAGIVKVRFNRIYNVAKQKDGFYFGDIRPMVAPEGDTYSDRGGQKIRFPTEGLGFFIKFIPKPGTGDLIAVITSSARGEVYVRADGAKTPLAVGDKYDKDSGEYRWSAQTEIPEWGQKLKMSVSDIMLYPDQLNGKIIEAEFYIAAQVRNLSTGFSTTISCGSGHAYVPVTFAAEGKPFFVEIASRGNLNTRVCKVFVRVKVDSSGRVSLEALGRRTSGSGDSAEYRW